MLVFRHIVSRRADFVLVLLASRMLLLVIDHCDHDYEQAHEGSFGCGCRGVKFPG
jgi:hypothetical protein